MREVCPACGSSRFRRAWAIQQYVFSRCAACASLWVENPPAADALASLYSDGSYFENPDFGSSTGYHGYLDYLADRDEIAAKFALVLAHIEAQVQPGRLLDIGAGPGLLVATARDRGWDASGIDLNPWAARYAREELGVEVREAALGDLRAEATDFDALAMMDLVEHVPDADRLMADALRVLRPGGILAVLTPDAGSAISRALGRRWPEAIRAPEHLTLFSRAGLATLLARHGFETIGAHSIGKTTSVQTLIADVAPVAPGLVKRIGGAVSTLGFGERTIDFDPRTKFCLYARKATDSSVAFAGGVRRPARLPKRVPTTPPAEAVDADLRELAGARRLAAWMFDQYAGAIGPDVAEIGAGIGTFSERLLAAGARRLLLIEPEPGGARELERRFAADSRVVVALDELPGSSALAARAGTLDLVVCQNVLEHIDDDAAVIAEMAGALRPGGTLALLVPAGPRLYGSLDLAYGHRRRYTRERVERLLAQAGLEAKRVHAFNLLGVPGWWLSNRTGRTGIDPHALGVYEALVPLARRAEERMKPQFGLSLIALAQRPGDPG